MVSKKLPQQKSSGNDLTQFLNSAEKLPQRLSDKPTNCGRLLFALDATASRQPSWDRACHLQAEMFIATDSLGGLQLQLCYYLGFNEFHTSPWLENSSALLTTMSAVHCLGGYTQINRVLDHAISENQRQSINESKFELFPCGSRDDVRAIPQRPRRRST